MKQKRSSAQRDEWKGGDYFPLEDMTQQPQQHHRQDRATSSNAVDDNESFLENSNPSMPAIHNLDEFLTNVYNYYVAKGFYCILFDHFFELFTSLFVVTFFTFLVSFVDYYKVLFADSKSINEVVDFSRSVPSWLIIFLILFCSYWLMKFFRFLVELRSIFEVKRFYHDVLRITEEDIQTIEWSKIATKLVGVPRLCLVKQNMSALDIANRIMRKENYIIGMIDRKIFDLSIPFPFLRQYKFITKTLEWSIMYVLYNHIFDANGVVKEEYFDPTQRDRLARGLTRRFRMIGLVGLFASPFIFFFLLIYYFFKYAEEFKNKPGSLGSREWSPLAKWKFREFNELPHLFNIRLNLSYPHANKYVDSFSSELLSIFAKFISFVLGSILAVFLVFGVINDDFLFSFDLFGRTPIWYVGIFGTALAICRSLIPEENEVFNPAKHMIKVVKYTHYIPKSWSGRTHTYTVRNRFLKLFEYRIVDFLREVSSVIFAPFILLFSLPNSSLAILEFIAMYTVNLEGVGKICMFGTFTNLSRYGNTLNQANKSGMVRSFSETDHNSHNKQDKVERSVVNFKIANPEWHIPDHDVLEELNSYIGTALQQQQQQEQQEQQQEQQSQNSVIFNGGRGKEPSYRSAYLDNIEDSRIISPELLNLVYNSAHSNDNSVRSSGRFNLDNVSTNCINDLQQSYFDSQIFLSPMKDTTKYNRKDSDDNDYV
ncbi:hypothetical protein SAMD00019534_021660 [Acytostelium subglobosum LB1]|uniref:hypothetical protein n=1 Tax=Acytostelium subglobosum LB1 TaxID=1410327 RepID=UPI000644C941|nr:hypothetical protein SAMD00019534_021660 [Acytostelium subglobosum LB1]GAM18991.1 hypothetical protein SAMD00019534_021660 [Acytostelium subglobosum LB1]|eukprot:XP_012756918.1 hypothetical protein SAMD00019534_021660 [Acytostelium subglobosum LB1]